MLAPGALYDEVEPYLQCGTLRLSIHSTAARGDKPPSVTIGIEGGQAALAAGSDDEILLAVRNATKIAEYLRAVLPPHWLVIH